MIKDQSLLPLVTLYRYCLNKIDFGHSWDSRHERVNSLLIMAEWMFQHP